MTELTKRFIEMRWGVLFALLTLLYGFALGIAFGGFEENLKDHLRTEGQAVFQSVYDGNEAALKKVLDKSWVYFKRAHLHANGLGTSALTLTFILACVAARSLVRLLVALGLGVGSLSYSLYWMLAALRAPALGSTGAAKDSLSWLAVPAAGLCILALLSVICIAVKAFLMSEREA